MDVEAGIHACKHSHVLARWHRQVALLERSRVGLVVANQLVGNAHCACLHRNNTVGLRVEWSSVSGVRSTPRGGLTVGSCGYSADEQPPKSTASRRVRALPNFISTIAWDEATVHGWPLRSPAHPPAAELASRQDVPTRHHSPC